METHTVTHLNILVSYQYIITCQTAKHFLEFFTLIKTCGVNEPADSSRTALGYTAGNAIRLILLH